MSKTIVFTASEPLTTEKMNKLLQDGQIQQALGSGATELMSQKAITDELNKKLNTSNLLNLVYPVGSIYMSVNSTSPSTFIGGTWTRIQNRFLLAAGSSYPAGVQGGAATVTLTTAQMPEHTHAQDAHSHSIYSGTTRDSYCYSLGSSGCGLGGVADNNYGTGDYRPVDRRGNTIVKSEAPSIKKTGSGSPFDIMPPYLAVYIWKRTA